MYQRPANVSRRRTDWCLTRQRPLSAPSSLEGTACRSPSIGMSWMARLGDGDNTPSGLAGACLATVTARCHPMVTMNTTPSSCLSGYLALARLTDFVTLDSLCVTDSLGQPLPSPLYPPCACWQWHIMPAAKTTLMTGDPVSDTAGPSGSSWPALLYPDNGHSMTSSRTGFWALASLPFLSHVHMWTCLISEWRAGLTSGGWGFGCVGLTWAWLVNAW